MNFLVVASRTLINNIGLILSFTLDLKHLLQERSQPMSASTSEDLLPVASTPVVLPAFVDDDFPPAAEEDDGTDVQDKNLSDTGGGSHHSRTKTPTADSEWVVESTFAILKQPFRNSFLLVSIFCFRRDFHLLPIVRFDRQICPKRLL